jgi:hypothetical protein
LPVIGFAKGGLAPFIVPELDLTLEYGHSTAQKIHSLIKKISDPSFAVSRLPFNVSEYSLETRKSTFQTLAGPTVKRILLVSDFKNKIGGIETYIHDVKIILESMGYEVKMFGKNISSGTR